MRMKVVDSWKPTRAMESEGESRDKSKNETFLGYRYAIQAAVQIKTESFVNQE
jgi:hypothetical protein